MTEADRIFSRFPDYIREYISDLVLSEYIVPEGDDESEFKVP